MQNEMERAYERLGRVRRFFWTGSACLEEKATGVIPSLDEVVRYNELIDTFAHLCCVLTISPNINSLPVEDPRPYCFLFENIKSVSRWMLAAEHPDGGQFHVHALIQTSQRSDAMRRTITSTWDRIAMCAMTDIEDPDPIISVVKIQTCRKPSSMISYMSKAPLWIITNGYTKDYLGYNVAHDLGARFREKKQDTAAKTKALASMNSVAEEITNVILDHQCKTVDDVFKFGPDVVAKYLHRPGINSIVQNCLTYCHATSGGWSILRFEERFTPSPEKIHQCLLHQGIDVEAFDELFYSWITCTSSKKNTLVLWGPSNTGKSTFIAGLKQVIPWGEIVNSNTFAFEALVGNKFGVWEEPLISPELAEKAKQVFEGMETAIPVKYKKPCKLPRTPIIMTTNHAPWRFCTKEEDMFRNRMHIIEWANDMTTPDYVCRGSSKCCQCGYCEASRCSEAATGCGSAGKMQGGKQPLQLAGSANASSDVGTRPLRRAREGKSQPREYSSGGEESSSSCGSVGEQCAKRRKLSGGSCSSTGDGVRPSGEHGPCYSGVGVLGLGGQSAECVESDNDRQSDGGDIWAGGLGSAGGRDASGGVHGAGGDRGQCSSEQEMVCVGSGEEAEETEISAGLSGVGGEMGTLTVPTKQDWSHYLSYLSTFYK
uniref:Nonstructural protein 1 n=1 Tax=Hamaparvovirinae sp. TaxID=2809447 RepID=A0AAU7P174_9VIRU